MRHYMDTGTYKSCKSSGAKYFVKEIDEEANSALKPNVPKRTL